MGSTRQTLRRRLVAPLAVAAAFAWHPALADAFAACEADGDPCPVTAPPRDWLRCPAILELEAPGELLIVGDVHGHYEELVELLAAAGVLAAVPDDPAQAEWAAGDAVLVTPGDTISKGRQALEVLALLETLAAAAEEAGGRVIATMGNHEAEFLADPCVRKARKFRKELCAAEIDPSRVAARADAAGIGERFHCRPLAARVSTAAGVWFVSHAGSTGGRTLDELRVAIENGVDGEEGYRADVLLGDEGLLEARLEPPWWEIAGQPGAGEERLRAAVERLGADHLVIGHQPGKYRFDDGSKRKKGELFQKFGLVFLVDAGVSKGHSDGALLRVERLQDGRPRATVVEPDGSEETLWTADRASEWSPDAATFVFASRRGGDSDLWLQRGPAGEAENLTRDPGPDLAASWFPDGTRVAFQSMRDGHREVYVMEVDGSGATNLTRHPAHDLLPDVSPDGRRLAFFSDRGIEHDPRSLPGHLYVMPSGGGEPERLTREPLSSTFGPDWSPDGRSLLYARDFDGDIDLVVLDLESGVERRLEGSDAAEFGGRFSPDGARVAFHAAQSDGEARIVVMDLDGSARREVTRGAQHYGPHWSPDGRWLMFTGAPLGATRFDVLVVPAEGGEVTPFAATESDERGGVWAPAH